MFCYYCPFCLKVTIMVEFANMFLGYDVTLHLANAKDMLYIVRNLDAVAKICRVLCWFLQGNLQLGYLFSKA